MLNDLRIVEMAEGMAAQVAGLMLSEPGADVLKIERPGGEPARGSAHFANWNRGKRSLELDLYSTEGLAALYAKRATGKGVMTQTSLLGVGAFSQGEHLILPDGSISHTTRLDSDQTGFGPYHRIFETQDDWIAIAAHGDADKAAVRSVLGADEAGFARAAKARGAAELLAALEAAGVPCDLVTFENAMNRFFDDPTNRELGLISALPHPVFGIVEQTGAFWCFPDTGLKIERACPTIGQHTDEILREMGYSDAEIADFRAKKIIV